MFTCERQRARRLTGTIAPVAILCMTVVAAGCGSSEPAKESAPTPAAAPAPAAAAGEHADHDMATMTMSPAAAPNGARVFFVEPKEGATVSSPVHFVFGSEKFTISPVPQGEVEHPRPGMGHYHLGVDTDCMTANQVIPKGTPSWVHFGKGDDKIDMQLTSGPHKFALQIGDDLHRTIAGLCQTLTLTVK